MPRIGRIVRSGWWAWLIAASMWPRMASKNRAFGTPIHSASDAVVGKIGNTLATDIDTLTATEKELKGTLKPVTMKNTKVMDVFTPRVTDPVVHGRAYIERIRELSAGRGGEAGSEAPFGNGSFEIAANQASAAQLTGCGAGAAIELTAPV